MEERLEEMRKGRRERMEQEGMEETLGGMMRGRRETMRKGAIVSCSRQGMTN